MSSTIDWPYNFNQRSVDAKALGTNVMMHAERTKGMVPSIRPGIGVNQLFANPKPGSNFSGRDVLCDASAKPS